MRIPSLLVAGALCLVAPTLCAAPTPSEVATARTLFEEGVRFEEAGDWTHALERFRRVAAVKRNHIVRFHLGLCLERVGSLVAALEELEQAKQLALTEGGVDDKKTIAASSKHIAGLRARIPSIVVASPAIAGAALTIDGRTIATTLFDAPILLDPGAHEIGVRAPGHADFSTRVTLADGVTTPVVVEPALRALDPAAPPVVDGAGDDRERSTARVWAWTLAGIGVASLGGAGVMYAMRSRTLDDLDSSCAPDRTQCDPEKRSLEDRGRGYTTAGNVLLGVGAVAAVGAIVILVIEPSGKSTPAVAISGGLGSVAVSATF